MLETPPPPKKSILNWRFNSISFCKVQKLNNMSSNSTYKGGHKGRAEGVLTLCSWSTHHQWEGKRSNSWPIEGGQYIVLGFKKKTWKCWNINLLGQNENIFLGSPSLFCYFTLLCLGRVELDQGLQLSELTQVLPSLTNPGKLYDSDTHM